MFPRHPVPWWPWSLAGLPLLITVASLAWIPRAYGQSPAVSVTTSAPIAHPSLPLVQGADPCQIKFDRARFLDGTLDGAVEAMRIYLDVYHDRICMGASTQGNYNILLGLSKSSLHVGNKLLAVIYFLQYKDMLRITNTSMHQRVIPHMQQMNDALNEFIVNQKFSPQSRSAIEMLLDYIDRSHNPEALFQLGSFYCDTLNAPEAAQALFDYYLFVPARPNQKQHLTRASCTREVPPPIALTRSPLDKQVSPVPVGVPPIPAAAVPKSRPLYTRWWLWSLVALGVASSVTGAMLAARSSTSPTNDPYANTLVILF